MELTRSHPLLGTFVEINIIADAQREALIAASNAGFDAVKAVQEAMSFHDVSSELSQINAKAHLGPMPISKGL